MFFKGGESKKVENSITKRDIDLSITGFMMLFRNYVFIFSCHHWTMTFLAPRLKIAKATASVEFRI